MVWFDNSLDNGNRILVAIPDGIIPRVWEHIMQQSLRLRLYELQIFYAEKSIEQNEKIMRMEYPLKHLAQQLAQSHVRQGNIKKKPCEVCGAKKSDAHHDDYSAPLDVRWLCRRHHMQWHAENEAIYNPEWEDMVIGYKLEIRPKP